MVCVEQISFHRPTLGDCLPLEFCGQPLACPPRIGVGLVIADVAHRRGSQIRERLLAAESKDALLAVDLIVLPRPGARSSREP